MRVKTFKGFAYSQIRSKVMRWTAKHPEVVIEKVIEKRIPRKRTYKVFYR